MRVSELCRSAAHWGSAFDPIWSSPNRRQWTQRSIDAAISARQSPNADVQLQAEAALQIVDGYLALHKGDEALDAWRELRSLVTANRELRDQSAIRDAVGKSRWQVMQLQSLQWAPRGFSSTEFAVAANLLYESGIIAWKEWVPRALQVDTSPRSLDELKTSMSEPVGLGLRSGLKRKPLASADVEAACKSLARKRFLKAATTAGVPAYKLTHLGAWALRRHSLARTVTIGGLDYLIT